MTSGKNGGRLASIRKRQEHIAKFAHVSLREI